MTSLRYTRGDELPAWAETVLLNGAVPDLSSGHTFSVVIRDGDVAVLTKTTNITGSALGVVTVAWADGELDIAPDVYRVVLTVTRTSDSAEWTVQRPIEIVAA